MTLRLLNLAVLTVGHFEEIRKWRDEQRNILRTKDDMSPADYRQYLIDDECKRYSNENHLYGIEADGKFIAFGGLTHIKWGLSHATSAELSFICVSHEYYETAFRFHLRKSQDLYFGNQYYKGVELFSETYLFRAEHINILEQEGFRQVCIYRGSTFHIMAREDYELSQ